MESASQKLDYIQVENLEKWFEADKNAFYLDCNKNRRQRGINYSGDSTRRDMANEQARLAPTPVCTVFSYANEFLEKLRASNGCKKPNIQVDSIELDGLQQIIIDNGMIVRKCSWQDHRYDEGAGEYVFWDPKYDVICERFQLENPADIVWLKFTKQGHLGVVAVSHDINHEKDTTSGQLVAHVNEDWDNSFVLIFPLTPEIRGNWYRGDIERALGNYLISLGVPIIDYYSHNY